ncbi:MAG: hypothetical protein BJ554DRAFT_3744 [Olpidium bornovanus]|uniref:Uncharacterized protein n=1 Tax=Olpidium bornovanus TaxID=278681 RepID=A0A8H7ZNZ7_9FUNG|nr:MAG: hypothetical protein BJ554DRAFT_3744 [Olpidium bornovanus]
MGRSARKFRCHAPAPLKPTPNGRAAPEIWPWVEGGLGAGQAGIPAQPPTSSARHTRLPPDIPLSPSPIYSSYCAATAAARVSQRGTPMEVRFAVRASGSKGLPSAFLLFLAFNAVRGAEVLCPAPTVDCGYFGCFPPASECPPDCDTFEVPETCHALTSTGLPLASSLGADVTCYDLGNGECSDDCFHCRYFGCLPSGTNCPAYCDKFGSLDCESMGGVAGGLACQWNSISEICEAAHGFRRFTTQLVRAAFFFLLFFRDASAARSAQQGTLPPSAAGASGVDRRRRGPGHAAGPPDRAAGAGAAGLGGRAGQRRSTGVLRRGRFRLVRPGVRLRLPLPPAGSGGEAEADPRRARAPAPPRVVPRAHPAGGHPGRPLRRRRRRAAPRIVRVAAARNGGPLLSGSPGPAGGARPRGRPAPRKPARSAPARLLSLAAKAVCRRTRRRRHQEFRVHELRRRRPAAPRVCRGSGQNGTISAGRRLALGDRGLGQLSEKPVTGHV